MRVGLLHIQEGGVETGIDGQVELIHRVVCDGHARGRRLSVVDHGVDAAKLSDCLVDNVLDYRLVVLAGRDVRLNRQHLDAVLGLQALLSSIELRDIATGDDEVRALLCERDVDTVTDGAGAAVFKGRLATAGDDNDLAVEHAHGSSLLVGSERLYAVRRKSQRTMGIGY